MTLEELKKTVITIKVDKRIVLGEDMYEEDLQDILCDLIEDGYSDDKILNYIQSKYYSIMDELVDIDDFSVFIEYGNI